MLGGSGSAPMSHVGALLNLQGGGDVTCLLGGDLFIQAGSSMTDGNSGIFSAAGGTFNISARDITLISGSNAVGTNFVFFVTVGGDMSITSTGPNGISSHGGTADGCNVFFGAGGTLNITATSLQLIGGSAPNTEAIIAAGNQLTMNIARDVNLTSQPVVGGGFAIIGNFGPPIQMDLNIGGNININAFGSDCFIAAAGAGPHTLNIDATNLNIASFSDGSAFIQVEDGVLNCNILGNCTFTGGTVAPAMGISFVGITGASTAGLTTNLNVTAGDFLITGGSASSCYAGILLGDHTTGMGGGGGEIHITATGSSGITLNGGTANDTPAVIEIIGTAATNAIFFDVTSSSGHVVLNGSPVGGLTNAGAHIRTSSGSIIDPVGGSIILNGTMSGPAVISVGPGPAAPLLLIAGVNIELRSAFSSIQNLSAGDLTLVVDADFPEPFLGPGALLTATGSTIFTTGGALRIFTSQQSFNQILGMLNGLSFTPGPIFSDTAQEIWGVYYPSLRGGFPFTIFYKNILQLLAQQAATIASELASGLHPFNEFPGWVERFTMSAEDFTQVHYLRRRYLSLFDHPKTWTYLMPE